MKYLVKNVYFIAFALLLVCVASSIVQNASPEAVRLLTASGFIVLLVALVALVMGTIESAKHNN